MTNGNVIKNDKMENKNKHHQDKRGQMTEDEKDDKRERNKKQHQDKTFK